MTKKMFEGWTKTESSKDPSEGLDTERAKSLGEEKRLTLICSNESVHVTLFQDVTLSTCGSIIHSS